MYKIYFFVLILLPGIVSAQQTIVSDGKQKILLQNDGAYQILAEDESTILLPVTENELMDVQNFEIWHRGAKIIEAEYFVKIYTLQKEVDVLRLEMKHAKTTDNVKIQEDCENKIKELRLRLKDIERLYDNALYYKKSADKLEGSNVEKNIKKHIKLVDYVRSKDYLFKTIQYRNHEASAWSSFQVLEVFEEENPKPLVSDTIITMKKNKIIKNDCRLISRKSIDEVEVIHDFIPIFNYTPERLQIFLKNENLLEGSVRLREKNKMHYLDLQIIVKSKDAARSYGHIAEGNLIRIEFINGLRLNLKTTGQIPGRIEEYSGKVVYMISFPLDKVMIKQLEKLPVDNVGIMWSSGFEKYEVYELDVILRQLACIKSVNTL